jgi:tetratricopeptide (TPR) repeat protein
MGEFDRAQPALERFAKLAPDNANSYTLLGDSLRYQGDFDAAIKLYGKALEIDPAMREVAASLATIDYLRGEYQQAEQGFEKIVNDESLIVSERLDAMFVLQALLAAEGDFAGADSLIERFSAEIKEEKIREAMATSIRALLKLETGNEAAARELATSAISLSPGVPTRYLFARGLLELRFSEYDKVSTTAAEILSHALPPEDPDRTEEKAAAYLAGMAWLEQGDMEKADRNLTKATELAGYSYRIYELGHARVLTHQGQTQSAIEMVQSAILPNKADARIDFEPERVRAVLLKAEIYRDAGNLPMAGALAQQFLSRFDKASPSHPAAMLAMEIASEAGMARIHAETKGDPLAVLVN